MDFPACSFPVSVCQHNGEPGCLRRNFAEYGSFSQVDYNSHNDKTSNEFECRPQKGMGVLTGFDRNLPPLPLHTHSLSECHLIQDCILGLNHYEGAIKSAKCIAGHLSATSNMKTAQFKKKFTKAKGLIDQCLSAQARGQQWNTLNEAVPDEIKTLFREYSTFADVPNENCMMGYNRDFYQGLLCHKQTSNSTLLFHAAGERFKDIYVTEVSQEQECIPLGSKLSKVTLSEPIFQLDCSQYGALCARQENQSVVLTYDESEGCINESIQESSFGAKLSDVTFSPYNKDEMLISSTTGQVYLWNFDSGSHETFEKAQESDCPIHWISSHFAGHPRQIVIADCFFVDMFDHRDNFSKGVELFHLSDLLVKSHERVMATTSLGFPYHLVATDFTLFVIDQRFPGVPVLQWSTQNLNNPQYLKSLKLSDVGSGVDDGGSEHFIFLGSQQPAEVVCYPLHLSKSCAPVTRTLPWRVGKLGDFLNHETTSYQSHIIDVEKRFQSSLAGMTVLNESRGKNHGISVYQMDSYGDIFFQIFDLTPLDPGNYQLVGPSDKEKNAANCRTKDFLSSVDEVHIFDRRDQSSWLKSDEKDTFAFSDVQSVLTDGSNSLSLAEFKDLGLSYDTFTRICSQPNSKSRFVKYDKLCKTGPNTRLLMALKEKEEDIHDMLTEREEAYGEQKKNLRKEYLEKKGHAKLAETVVKKILKESVQLPKVEVKPSERPRKRRAT